MKLTEFVQIEKSVSEPVYEVKVQFENEQDAMGLLSLIEEWEIGNVMLSHGWGDIDSPTEGFDLQFREVRNA